MIRRKTPILRLLLPAIVCALSILGADGADAQVRRGRAPDVRPRWAPISIGVRFGYDQRASGVLLGGQLRIPVIRNGVVELATVADVVYPRFGRKERHYGAEVVWIPGGAQEGGVLIGGGVAWRKTDFGSISTNVPQTTYFGYSLVIGVKSRLGPLEVEVNIRWIYLNDTLYRPNSVSLGLNYPLWSVRRPEVR